jgi:hypothetical protein
MVLKDSENKMKNYFDVGRLKKTAILILPDSKAKKIDHDYLCKLTMK